VQLQATVDFGFCDLWAHFARVRAKKIVVIALTTIFAEVRASDESALRCASDCRLSACPVAARLTS